MVLIYLVIINVMSNVQCNCTYPTKEYHILRLYYDVYETSISIPVMIKRSTRLQSRASISSPGAVCSCLLLGVLFQGTIA